MSVPTRKRQAGGDKAGQAIVRLWGDVPVVDATKEIRIFFRPEDLAGAVRKDETSCVFAQACKRMYGTKKVLFFRSVAYIELPQADGTKRIERFKMGREMRRIIEDFDRGNKVLPEAGFVLKPPSHGSTLNNQRKRAMEAYRRLNPPGGPSKYIPKDKRRYRDKEIAVDLDVRSGTGATQATFTRKSVKDYNAQVAELLKRRKKA